MGIYNYFQLKSQRDFAVENMFKIQLAILRCSAMMPVEYYRWLPSWLSFLSYILNGIYLVFAQFLAAHLCILHFISSIIDLRNSSPIMVTVNNMVQGIIYGFTFFVVIMFQLRYKTVLNIFEEFNQKCRKRSARGMTYVTGENAFKISRNLTKYWCFLCVLGTANYAIAPLILRRRVLPLGCWYPFDPFAPVYYEIIFVLQNLGQYLVGIGFAIAGAMLLSCAIILTGQLDMLCCSLKNIRYTAMLMNGGHSNELFSAQKKLTNNEPISNLMTLSDEHQENLLDINIPVTRNFPDKRFSIRNEDRFLLDLNEELQDAIIDCVEHHIIIINLHRKVDNFFSFYVLVKSLQITFQICFLAYISINTDMTLVSLINILEYFLLTLTELFLLTFICHLFQLQSMKITDAIQSSEWHLCGGPLRRSAILMMAKSLKPLYMSGGGFFVLDLIKLRSIITTSFSFFTLLLKISNKK